MAKIKFIENPDTGTPVTQLSLQAGDTIALDNETFQIGRLEQATDDPESFQVYLDKPAEQPTV